MNQITKTEAPESFGLGEDGAAEFQAPGGGGDEYRTGSWKGDMK